MLTRHKLNHTIFGPIDDEINRHAVCILTFAYAKTNIRLQFTRRGSARRSDTDWQVIEAVHATNHGMVLK